MAQRPVNEVSLPMGKITGVHTNTNGTDLHVVSPIDGELVGVMFYPNVVIDAALTLDVFKGSAGSEVNLGALLVPSPTQPADTGAMLVPTAKVYVAAGDKLRVETNGEQIANTTAWLTAIIRP